MDKRARLNELDAEIRQLHKEINAMSLTSEMSKIDEIMERLVSLSGESLELLNKEEE